MGTKTIEDHNAECARRKEPRSQFRVVIVAPREDVDFSNVPPKELAKHRITRKVDGHKDGLLRAFGFVKFGTTLYVDETDVWWTEEPI